MRLQDLTTARGRRLAVAGLSLMLVAGAFWSCRHLGVQSQPIDPCPAVDCSMGCPMTAPPGCSTVVSENPAPPVEPAPVQDVQAAELGVAPGSRLSCAMAELGHACDELIPALSQPPLFLLLCQHLA